MNLKCKRFTYGLLAVLFSLNIFSASAAEPEVYEEEEVVVTATRTSQTQLESPGMTEVITEEEIQASGATTVAEILTQKGFVVSSYSGSSGTAFIRFDGGEADQTLILVNGIPVNSGTVGMVDLSYLPTAGISRIEVAHGPLSSLYGSSAIGGVVNIITDLTGKPYNNIELAYGNTDQGNVDSGQATLKIQQEKYGLAFGASMNDGFRENSKTDKYFFMYQYDFIQDKDEALSLYLQSTVKKSELPGPVYSPTFEDDQSDEIHGISLSGKRHIIGGLWEYKIYSNYWKETSHRSLSDDEYDYTNYGIDAAGLYTIGNHELLLGAAYVDSSTDSTAYGRHHLNNAGFYIQENLYLNDRWKQIIGLRWDTGSEYNSPVCPKVHLVFLVNDNFSIKFGYGKSFNAPTISDLYSIPGGNPDLKPEKGDRYDITGEWRNNFHSVSLNVYRTNLRDGIGWLCVGPTPNDWAARNFDKINATGVNLNWKIRWNDYLNSTLKYGWVDKERWDSDTNSYKDDHFFGKNKLALGLSFKYAAFSSNLSWEYVWDRSNQEDYSTYPTKLVAMEDYDVLNWNLAYIVNQAITYKLSINNLLDGDYAIYHGYPVSEREYKLSAAYSF